ncbi:hypothetical protein OV450_7959 [Actinobacteria bacterium OV450]|nr:hypothetical protein OV450_7959 [Actinobacteria bacterium OV450]
MLATEEARKKLQRHVAEAARRYRESTTERERIEEQLAAGVLFPDDPERLAARAERILDRGGLPPTAAREGVRAQILNLPQAHERVIGLSSDLQAWNFLPRGARAGSTVARITLRHASREIPHGTGFLVSPRLLMTNHHVLPDEGFTRRCFLEFNAQVTMDLVADAVIRMDFDPGAFFTADRELDFALVAVAPAVDGRLPGQIFGWNRLSAQIGNLVIGERVNIIGHPSGRLKEVALRDNALLVRLEDFLHYKTDTEPGNSGSPVFNDQWEVVALHHSGVPRTNDEGRQLRKDGRIWQEGDGDDAIDWIANEGVRISSILRHLAGLRLDSARRAFLAEMGPDAGLDQGVVPNLGETVVVPPQPAEPTGLLPHVIATVPQETAATVTATLRASTPPATGLRARREKGTFGGGKRHLIYLHGRRQQGKDPEDLRRDWTAGLNRGLTRAGMDPVDPADVWFPFYGNRLADLMGWKETATGVAEPAEMTSASAAERPPAGSPLGLYEHMLIEAATKAGMPQNGDVPMEGLEGTLLGGFHRALGWLTAHSEVDELTIATIFRDVSRYLSDPNVRNSVLDAVLKDVPTTGEAVLVAHSLGTVVGMDLMSRLPDLNLALFVTAGSPLGMNAVNQHLLVPGPHRPEIVRDWLNVWCHTDAVAVGCPLERQGWGKLTEVAVVNGCERAHNIDEYLSHATVASQIGEALHVF